MGIAVEMPEVQIVDYGTAPTVYASQLGKVSVNQQDGTAQFSLTLHVENVEGTHENRLAAVVIMPLAAIMPAVQATLAALHTRALPVEIAAALVQ